MLLSPPFCLSKINKHILGGGERKTEREEERKKKRREGGKRKRKHREVGMLPSEGFMLLHPSTSFPISELGPGLVMRPVFTACIQLPVHIDGVRFYTISSHIHKTEYLTLNRISSKPLYFISGRTRGNVSGISTFSNTACSVSILLFQLKKNYYFGKIHLGSN